MPGTATVQAGTARSLYIYLVSGVAAIAGLLFGFDIAVINGALLFLREHFRLTEFQTEVAASSLLAGCVAGAAAGGWLSDRLGRRRVLRFSAVLFTVSALGAALPRTMAEFVGARFVGGCAIGVASLLAPLYIAELAPARIRGRLVALNQMAIVSGILLAYLVNWSFSFIGPESWRLMFAFAALPSLIFLAALWFVPESPRWLIEQQDETTALAVLDRIHTPRDTVVEFDAIRDAIEEERGTMAELLQPGFRRALGIALVLAIVQQWSGVNTVLFYGALILKEQVGGHTHTDAIGANVLFGVVNFLATAIALMVIDKAGRKMALMFSSAGMAAALCGLGFAFRVQPPPARLVIALMLLATASFAVGLGPAVWVVLAEIFPNRIRGRAMSLATVALWAACSALTLTFLSISSAIGVSGAFWLYAAICLFTLWLVWRVVPETKGKRREGIEMFWKEGGM